MRRRGFSFVELVVAMVIAGIIGAALVRLVISQARFVSSQDSHMRARAGARSAFVVLAFDSRSVTNGGLVSASPDSVTLRVPYAFGIACSQNSGNQIVALLPTDSARYATATLSGYAWRDSLGTYRFVEPATVADPQASASFCAGTPPDIASVALLAAESWGARAVALNPNDVTVASGTTVYMYEMVRFAFAPSTELSGRRALWRTSLATGLREELVAPFDTSARFAFLVGPKLSLRANPPAVLDSVTGLRIALVGASETAPQGGALPTTFAISTNILFRNNVP